jgi:hypothetical protein
MFGVIVTISRCYVPKLGELVFVVETCPLTFISTFPTIFMFGVIVTISRCYVPKLSELVFVVETCPLTLK